MRPRRSSVPLAIALSLVWGCSAPPAPPPATVPPAADAGGKVARSSLGMVAAAQPLATAAGVEMLERGGNAADAAVAAAFAVSVVEPSMNSIGGRTQILVRTSDGRFHGIDATTQAPRTYDPDRAPQASYGYPTVGVPGAVAGLMRLLDEHGTLSRETVMAPAIRHAEEGFDLLPGEARRQAGVAAEVAESAGGRAYFLKPDGSPRAAGERFVQPELAATLRAIAAGGGDVFYRGEIADRIVADMRANGGAVTRESLAEYRAEDARIVRGSYRGYDIVGTFTPAAGALSIEVLHILENLDVSGLAPAEWAAATGQALALGFADARTYRAPDAWQRLTSREWARERAREIRLPAGPGSGRGGRVEAGLTGSGRREAAPGTRGGADVSPWSSVRAPAFSYRPGPDDSGHTTHLSTADGAGMMVALTQTIGPTMGSRVAAPGLGFLYAATLGGYLGRLEAGERASSNISPLMVFRDGRPVMVLGAAGGARIVSAVVQTVMRVVDQGLSLPDALAAPRVHPADGGIEMETTPGSGWDQDTVEQVRKLGLSVVPVARSGAFGRVHAVAFDPVEGVWVGAADPDWEGTAAGPRR